MTQTKKYKLLSDGRLEVTIENNDELQLPSSEGNIPIGKAKQTTVQTIDKDKMIELKKFTDQQLLGTQTKYNEIDKQYQSVKHVNEKLLPEDILKTIAKTLVSTNNKQRLKLMPLNKYLEQVGVKQQLSGQMEFLKTQIENMELDKKELDKYSS